jgi:hypothetical protein
MMQTGALVFICPTCYANSIVSYAVQTWGSYIWPARKVYSSVAGVQDTSTVSPNLLDDVVLIYRGVFNTSQPRIC